MEGLYDELWGKLLPDVIQDRAFSIPKPQHSLRLGYGVHLKEIDKAYPDPKFEEGKEKVFKVLKVRGNLPCGTDQLLVRQEYETIEGNLLGAESKKWAQVNLKTGKPAWGTNLDYEIAGQPGSGKSFFLSYLMVRRLLAGQPTAFRSHDGECYLFDSISHGSRTDANYLLNLPEDRKHQLWILTDKALADARWSKKNQGWFVVLAASPAIINASWQWREDRNVGSWYMSNGGWDEIIAAFRLANCEPPTPHQLAMLFTIFDSLGPIARTCLQSISVMDVDAYKLSLDNYLSEVDREIDMFITEGGFQTLETSAHEHASHRILIMHPTHNERLYNAQIVSRWIAHRIHEKARMESPLRCFQLYQQLAH